MRVAKIESYSRWQIGFSWIVANVVGICAGVSVAAMLNGTIWSSCPGLCLIDNPIQRKLVIGLCIGGFAGMAEWLALRQLSRWWILVSIFSWAAGLAGAESIRSLVSNSKFMGAIAGILIGLIEWFVLRYSIPKAHRWVLARVLSAFILLGGGWIQPNLSMYDLLNHTIVFVVLGTITGAITGAALIWLVRPFAPAVEIETQIE